MLVKSLVAYHLKDIGLIPSYNEINWGYANIVKGECELDAVNVHVTT